MNEMKEIKNNRVKEDNSKNSIEWAIDVPIFSTRVILRDLGIAIGIPFGILVVVLVVLGGVNGFHGDILYALGLIGTLFILTFIFIRLVYGGKYAAAFLINESGIRNYTQKRQAKRNRIINILTVIIGILSRKPSAAGAGLLAQSNQDVFLRWNNIRKVKYDPLHHTIVVRGGLTEKIALFCTEKNYGEVEKMIKRNLLKLLNEKNKRGDRNGKS